MNIRKTVLGIAATAAVAIGALPATTSTASAGYVISVGYGHGYGHGYRPHYRPHYNPYSCHFTYKKVWTYHGPIYVKKRVCW